jgi:uncharacterized protein (TIGR00369 family)
MGLRCNVQEVEGMSDGSTDQTDFVHQAMPFARFVGIEQVLGGPQGVTARVPWDAARCTAGGVLHGGLLMTLADTLGAAAAFAQLPAGASTATIQSSTNFLRPVTAGHAEAHAQVVRAGRQVIVVETRLVDAEGRLASLTIQSQAVIGP